MEKNNKNKSFLFQERAQEEPCYCGKLKAVEEEISGKDFETLMKYQGNIQKKDTYIFMFVSIYFQTKFTKFANIKEKEIRRIGAEEKRNREELIQQVNSI